MLRCLVLASLIACSLGAATRSRRPRLDGRIVGGEDANIEDYPYQVSFEYLTSHICGASIISENWVVTAAHCVDDVPASLVRFRAGSSNRESGGTVHPASEIIANPKYDFYTIDFDVAVVRVSTPFTIGSGVQRIPLTTSQPQPGQNAVVTGWGTLSSDVDTLPRRLQVVNVPIVSQEECNNAYAEYGGITENMICAAAPGGGKDACQGDSGGPLAVGGKLAGIVSWGGGCGEALYPGVYSNVASLRSFITENSGVN